jgi:hypothetical protein
MEVVYSPDGKRLATASNDGTLKIWEAATGQEVLTLRGHQRRVQAVAFSPDGDRLASGGEDRTVRVWDATPLTPELRLQRRAASRVNRLTAELLVKEDVLEQLRRDSTLGEPLQQQALTLAARYREDPFGLYNASIRVVIAPDRDQAAYRRALRQAEAAYRLDIEDTNRFNLVGMARYRVGDYRQALDALHNADTSFTARSKGGVPWNLAFLAMTHQRLADTDKARAVLGRLREAMKDPRWVKHAGSPALLREAEEQIEGKPSSPGK